MDLSFPGLNDAQSTASPLGLDYGWLVASLGAAQAMSPTASAEARISGAQQGPIEPIEALIALFQGKQGWATSVAVLESSFHPGAARFLAGKAM